MRFSFSAFVFVVVVLETTAINDVFSSTQNRKTTKKNHPAIAATAPPTPTPPVRYLVAQPAHECSIRMVPQEMTTGAVTFAYGRGGDSSTLDEEEPPRSYTLRATVSNATIAFAERPARSVLTVSTKDFVDLFEDELFVTSDPNGAITFGSASLDDGPLIAVLSQPKIVGTSPDNSTFVIEYNITQSESQSAVVSIEQFLEMSGSCSIFIDGLNDALGQFESDLSADFADL